MAEELKIEMPGPHAIALQLARQIAHEERGTSGVTIDRKYWLELYYDCRNVIYGSRPKHMKQDG